ncbi:non-ribosomal peptide synthase/polyketide synthase [Mycetohabitans endofungorum]|uniref:non-ribosomal peptide synthase/polyketide synthase n=1 Tax=Mycetohabitans endofungorum TaxID=417203 RepID=UPI0030CEB7DB
MAVSATPLATYSLSSEQKEVWLAQQFHPDIPAYNIAQYTVIEGAIDPAVFEAALCQVIGEVDSLRLQFVDSSEGLRQAIGSPAWSMPVLDLSTEANPHTSAQAWIRVDYEQPVDLVQGSLFCYALLKVASEQWIWYQRYCHIIIDSYGAVLIAQRVAHVYSAMRAGKKSEPCAFGSVLQLLDSDVQQASAQRERDEAYWLKQCADWTEPTTLVSCAAPLLQHRLRQTAYLPTQALGDFMSDTGRLAQILTVALTVYLHRMTGVQDVVLGLPVTARLGADRYIPGTLTHDIPLQFTMQSGMNLSSLLQQAAQQIQRGFRDQRYPSEALRCRLGLPPGQALFGATVNVMPFDYDMSFDGYPSTNHNLLNGPVDDLVLDVYWAPGSSQLRIDFNANPACYTVKELDAHQRRFVRFVHALAANATQPIGRIDLLDAEERHRLLVEWNATQQDYPSHRCIHQLFEAQAERTPQAPALVVEERTLSYAQLNAQANRLAHQLIGLGVQPDTRVALCVARSPAMIVGLLAILKAGGAYVPLDPAYPSERLTHILTDSAPELVLADTTGQAALGQAALASRTVLDPNVLPERATTNPHVPELLSSHLAYVIYTSGSTGTPKGVMVEHRSVVNLVQAQISCFDIGPFSRILQFASLGFDVNASETFIALTSGASLYLPPDTARHDRTELWCYLEKHAITYADIPPALLQAGDDLPHLTTPLTLILGGEAPSATLLRNLVRQGAVVFNAYGPTETTICSTVWRGSQDFNGEVVPIGRPLDNTRVYLLDAHGQPVPLGAVGELYIGGVGVARGYLNRTALTAERFVTDPFCGVENARMYKTGDLARYLPDGNLVFLGRNDHQIKIRGFRIEPGEIEARLREHPQVRDAAVLTSGDGGAKRLIAYVVAECDEQLANTLRAHLLTSLPEYMVPAAFVRLDAFPLTPSGKLDRRALPAPHANAFARQAYEAPQGEAETALAAIWAELLGLSHIGRHDSFFALGGNSLLAVQMIDRLRRVGLMLSVRALFETPTLSVLAQSLGQHREVVVPPNRITPDTTTLTPEQLPLIELTQADIDRIVTQVPGGIANIQDIYALSPLQDGILFHHLLAADRDPYLLTTQMAFANRQVLDRYLEAVQQVVNRHDILRTAFVWEGLSVPAQVVWRHASPAVTELKLNPDDGPVIEQLLRRFDPTQYRIDLTQAPLLHFVIAQDGDGRWLLLELLHHLIGDHATQEIMQNEVQAFLEGRGDALPPARPFRNLVAQARLGMSESEHARFFTEMLADVDEPTLPFGLTDVHRDGTQVTESHRMLPQGLNDRLRTQAKQLGVSLASLCHLAWAQVLARVTGQQQVVFGTVLFGRMQAGDGADSAMGLFINTLPLRVDLNNSVQDGVRHTHARLATLLEHEHASLGLAQRCSGVPAGTPLFSALLNYVHEGVSPSEIQTTPGIEFLGAQERDNYPLGLSVADRGHALGLTAQAVQPLDPDRIVGYMQQALESLAAALEHTPNLPVQQLNVLPANERTLLLETWNATQQDYPAHQCIHQLFEAQVEHTPQAPALVVEERTLSYAQLNAQANRLAHQLIELGVKPDARVAICVERSPAMVVGLLAILKAGGAYVPLDPAYPGERLAHILTDAAPDIVLADAVGRAALGEATLASRTVLDPHVLPARADTNPSVLALTSRHLAYVIYTSGSTGVPKGVMVHHQGVVRLVRNTDYIKVEPGAVFALASNLAFDATTFEIWAPLLNGARIEVIERETLLSPATLARKLKQSGVTVLFLTTALFNQMVKEKVEAFSDLHYLLFGGENADPRCVFRVLQQAKPRHLLHVYGPTETVTYASWYEVRNVKQDTSIPIGRPIANTRIYLLDRYGQPVPLGAVGELYIGGAGVARGYLNRPELTAERFVRDPFSDEPNARMYKTGDLARYLPDGNLEFLGRNDHQIKIRGFRIEPGEIEACLAQHAQVREAVVLALGEGQDKRLVAYVVADPDDALAGILRTHVAAALPDYMVPSAFVQLDAFPLTPNGKLDRRALPAPDAQAFAHQAYEAPQGELETTLAAIWSELLGVERISRHDSFFALGGHSLLAVRLMNRVAMLGIVLPLATMFAAPTLAGLAATLNAHRTDRAVLPVITPVSRDGALPLSFAQQRLWFLAQLDGASDSYHIPLTLRLRGTLNITAWQLALDALFARHEALRSVFVSVDGQPQVQLLPAEVGVPMAWHDLRGVPDAQAQLVRLSAEAAQAPFDLVHGPLVRACGMQLTDDEYVMLLVQHHIVSDGWSIGVLVRELNTLYRAACDGQTDPLPALTIQYPDYAAWQRQWLSGERLKAQSAYWCTQLADAPVLLALPTDRPRPAQQSFAGACVPIRIDAQTTRALKRVSQAQGATLFMMVLAAWSAVLARLSGQEDLVVGTPSANRHHPQIEPLIGFFVNTLALRVDVSGEPSATQLLERVRRTTLEAQAHQDVPFEQVVEIVQPPRRLEHTPLFQVMFAWQSNERAVWDLPEVEVTPADWAYDVVKFDLDLHLYESGEEIVGALGYATALFDRATIERHVGYLQTMLQAMAADDPYPVTRVELLSPAERTLLLQTWNATQRDYPAHQCIHQLFEAQVERTPEAMALVYEEQTLSYAQLNARANRLAHQLIELGVQPDARVATCMQRSPAMVVGLLAILKAGGAYVPLDPSYPGERLAHILADAAPDIVLADAAGRVALGDAALTDRTVLDPNRLPAQSETNPSVPALTSRHLAYVIYTSGSTGTPKGVMVEHRSIARLVINNGYIDVGAADRVAFAANPAFDASTFEVWAPLLNGAAAVVISRDTVLNPAAFAQTLQEQRISILWLTVGLFNQLFIELGPVFPQLKALIVGGDALDANVVVQVLQGTPPQQLINGYGPTESTTFTTTYRIDAIREDTLSIPIGRPIANTQIYLLDRNGQPVPLGAVGELYIGGAGVARGYLNRPELTAERFVCDPFSAEPDARMYKTGDLARYLPDGNLEFLGRNDHQVKLRGFRIELGEIEACLTQHAQVREAVVLAVGEGSDKRLVAYVVAEPDDALAGTLRTHVAAALPEYMVPSAFVRLDALPLTPNGKLDRRALPAPSADAFAHQAYEAPQGELEIMLAEIWTELLGVEQVSRHDNFFVLGGHSLLAVRLMNRVAALGITLPLATLFAAPTLAGLSAVLEEQRTSDSGALPAITPISRDGALPLSFAQQRLWFFAQLDGASDTYHMPMALRLRGTLNRVAWQQALDALWARHEALRSAFVSVDGQPQVQLLPAEMGVPMTWHDLRGVRDAATQLVRLSAEAAQAPFDLARGPLMRACGMQLAEDEHVMLLVQHHIVSDGWSVGVLVRELSALYRAACGEPADPLLPLTIQYPDYAAWQRQWLSGERLKAQSEYWRTQLADVPVLLALPTDRPRPAQQSFAGACVPIQIDTPTTQALKRLSQAQGATLFMTVLAAWSAVLARLSGQEDLVIGTPSANRHHPQIEPLIGFFVNTLALRVDVSGEPSAAQLLERVRRTTLGAQAHQDVPFEQVVEIVQPPRRLDHTPLFQVMFVWQSNERAVWDLPEVEVTPADWAYDVAKFDLNLHLYEAGGEMVGVLHYATALFDRATIERHVGYLQTMLQAMAADASHPVTRVELLSPGERTLLLQTWNATQQDYPSHRCIHQLFEAQAERTPDATALVYEDQTLSYAQLNDRANQLAHYLRTLDVGPEVVVGLCAERSLEAIIGLLGILKAGGAYLPLDPSHPAERLASMLRQASVTVLVTQSHLKARLPEIQARRIDLDKDWAKIAACPKTPPDSGVTAEHLAYIIYTSGSTGQPKGVMHSHRGVVNYLNFLTCHYAITCADTILNITGLAFDPCMRDLFGPLTAGARVIIVPNEREKEPGRYLSAIRERSVTKLLSITPSFLRSLCESVPKGPIASSLNTILTSGEPLEASVCEQVHKAFGPQVTVVNQYGPSECTMVSTWFKADAQHEGRVPIGRPVPNVRVYVLGQHLEPMPLGVTGELYIAGAGVARGYINQPELSAERFIPSPFEPGERLYRTGDLARWRADGQLEYIGRVDQQIKIRGFRIEPGEIEAALVKHPSIAQSVVVSREDHPGDRRLVAYWVAADGGAMTPVELKAYLSQTLPAYMVPVAFVQLDTLPLTLSGKLNQRALPAPSGAAFALQVYEAPQGELETTLAAIWSELLGVERVGRYDNFFTLGGHSLLAVRLMNRVAMLGIALPLATLFAAPTLAGLAAALNAQRTDTAVLPVITPVSRDGALPLSFAQQRLWFLAQLDGASDSYHISLALRLRGTLNITAWQQALDALFARHEALRSVFVSVDGQPQVQLLPAETGVPMAWHDLRRAPDADTQLAQLSAEAAQAPFDLSRGPLMRVCGIQLADDEHVMLLVQHHIVSDGWSMGVLVRELSALYRAACDGQTDPLSLLTIQYPDYTVWQRQWFTGERLEAQSAYWRTQLADAPVLLALPTDRPRPAQQSFAGAYVPIRIDAQTTRELKRLSQAQGATLFMTVLAAWSAVLARLSGQEDLVIGTPSANRHHPQIEPLIGFFVNTLALRLDVSGEPSAAQLLERVRRTTLEAQAHQDVPFEQVVEIVQPPRRLEHTPLFQVMFAWQSNERAVWDLPVLEVTPADLAYDVAKFDLDLHLYEAGGEIVGGLNYATALFDRATIERHVGYLQTMLQAMAADAQQPVMRVALLSPAERTLLLQTWNATQQDYPSHQCIHQLFEAQVERAPQATALVYEDQTLSYAQLNARANRLAHQLIELGVKPDARVAICVQRSPAMMVGLLAILKAGGAYVPLDPAYPGARLAHILADAAPDIVLADAAGRAALGEAALAHRTVLDPNRLPARAETNPLVAELTSRHLAYVIYTSGSTGIPKGVLVQHSSVVNHGIVMAQRLGLSSRDRLLQFSSLSFDASVEEIFCTLCYGATLVLRTDAWLADAKQFWGLCEANRISLVDLPTQFWAQLIQEKAAVASSVRAILIGGDTLSASTQSAWLAGGHRARLLNTYGPTETTVIVTIYEVVDDSDHWRCIGRPIANTRIYLLDSYGQPVPLGAVGELYIGGAGVARGYLNRPELTAERFVRDPFVGEADARMYKTGDLARYLADGNLEFLGRNDHQVKIRGFRIELGEIEACLTQHAQVRDAVVLAMGKGQDKRLVAYVVAEPDDALAGILRTHVAAALPEYMMPSAFVRLDALPLTPNGKLDRRALPAPDAQAFAHQAYEVPQGELETTLAEIWSELLGVERTSRHDNFFALGGHSLLAVQMISRSRTALGISIPMPVLFEAPTLAALAQRVSVQENVQDESFAVLLPIQPHGTRPVLFCVHPVTGLSWHYRGLVSHLEADQPVYGLQARGLDGDSSPAATIEAMATDYIQQIRRIQPRGPYYLLGWSFGGQVVHSMATQLEQQGERVALLAVLDATPDYVQRDNQSKITEDDFYHLFVRHAAGSLSEAGQYLWEKTRTVLQNNVQLVQRFSPRVYSGDMLFFSATMARDAWTQPISPKVWQPYVMGNIEVHDIACQHYDMELPVPTAQIGRILRQKLNALQAA